MKQHFLCAILTMVIASAKADTIGDYTFELDGKPLDPGLMTTEGEGPVRGDVAVVGQFSFCLDQPGTYELIIKDELLYRKLDDGRMVVLACAVTDLPTKDPFGEG